MSPKIYDDLVERVVQHYLKSDDFNGYPLNVPGLQPLFPPDQLRTFLRPLIEKGRLVARYADWEINVFIRRMPDEPIEAQLKIPPFWIESCPGFVASRPVQPGACPAREVARPIKKASRPEGNGSRSGCRDSRPCRNGARL
jgi:hypothetical protein